MGMYYEVPGIRIFVQDKNNACWYASAMMLLNWRDNNKAGNKVQSSTVDDKTIAQYKANERIANDQILAFAKRLGLVAVTPQSPTIQGLLQWLKSYGPLWTNGVDHVVVIGGLRQDDDGGYSVKVYDPEPANGITWRTLAGWYTGFDPIEEDRKSSRDTRDTVEAVFLHC